MLRDIGAAEDAVQEAFARLRGRGVRPDKRPAKTGRVTRVQGGDVLRDEVLEEGSVHETPGDLSLVVLAHLGCNVVDCAALPCLGGAG
jgi:hypothetical protein